MSANNRIEQKNFMPMYIYPRVFQYFDFLSFKNDVTSDHKIGKKFFQIMLCQQMKLIINQFGLLFLPDTILMDKSVRSIRLVDVSASYELGIMAHFIFDVIGMDQPFRTSKNSVLRLPINVNIQSISTPDHLLEFYYHLNEFFGYFMIFDVII